jgi:hypothetical protein
MSKFEYETLLSGPIDYESQNFNSLGNYEEKLCRNLVFEK